jgi:hypothetical protein
MQTRVLVLAFSLLFTTAFIATPARAQNTSGQDTTSNDNSNDNSSNSTTEGTVVSASRNTLVVRDEDNHVHLFTYDRGSMRAKSLAAGARVRVAAGPADENGTRVARNVTVLSAASTGGSGSAGNAAGGSADKGAEAAPVPEKVRDIESEIRRDSRRWRLGVRAGQAFDPELFMFGVQSQMGPIFHPRVLFRPNAEFAFGEVTDLVSLNLEAIYRFPARDRRGNWTPYVGAGPAMIFIHQNFQAGRNIDFGNFDYETGFNVLAGVQSRRGAFVELKTSLYSGPAPKLRLIFGYNF